MVERSHFSFYKIGSSAILILIVEGLLLDSFVEVGAKKLQGLSVKSIF